MAPITSVGSVSAAPVGPLPPGVKTPTSDREKALYEACKGFEAVFVRQLVSGWLQSARGDGAATGPQGVYQNMADETMTRSLVEGGTFGLAGTVYGQLVQALGAVTPGIDGPPADPTPADGPPEGIA